MQIIDLRMEKDSNSKFDILHIPIGSLCKDFVLSSLDIVDDRLLNEGYLEVEPFSVNLGRKTAWQLIELDRIMAHFNLNYSVLTVVVGFQS